VHLDEAVRQRQADAHAARRVDRAPWSPA
jgi:hypothetical protein